MHTRATQINRKRLRPARKNEQTSPPTKDVFTRVTDAEEDTRRTGNYNCSTTGKHDRLREKKRWSVEPPPKKNTRLQASTILRSETLAQKKTCVHARHNLTGKNKACEKKRADPSSKKAVDIRVTEAEDTRRTGKLPLIYNREKLPPTRKKRERALNPHPPRNTR